MSFPCASHPLPTEFTPIEQMLLPLFRVLSDYLAATDFSLSEILMNYFTPGPYGLIRAG